eukprot:m.249024 g.249024  ORF g.249024 m.249024 type:complete len:1108 (+) comp19082_c0_seq4:119-3442(+)
MPSKAAQREAVVASVGSSASNLVDLNTRHKGQSDAFNFDEFFESLPRKLHAGFWDAVLPHLDEACNAVQVSLMPDNEEAGSDNNEELSEHVAVMAAVVTAASSAIAIDSPVVVEALQEAAALLHDQMFALPASEEQLREQIARLCETWWLSELAGKDELVPQTMSFLLVQSLSADAKPARVKRVFAFRHALMLLDFNDDTADALKAILQQCLVSSLYLTCTEGRRFLSFLFGLSTGFIPALHMTVKATIPFCPKSLLKEFGEVYYRAWRGASGPYLEAIERTCIQDLMDHAVHANKELAPVLRRVLDGFHSKKKERGVDEALVRLYEPILWRALRVARPSVRANAAALLCDAFPLQLPDATRPEIDQMLQKQFDIFKELLEDDVPIVRCTAVEGVCRIAGIYWELIPYPTIAALLTKMVNDLSRDATSAAVRTAVFKGINFVMGNHLALPLMKQLLPRLRDSIHDPSERVRSAFIDCLLFVKGIRDVKYWDVVPVEHLLARLEVDSHAIAEKLAGLMATSYFPQKKTDASRAGRCAKLLRVNPGAARRFYQLLPCRVATNTLARFVSVLSKTVLATLTDTNDMSEAEGEEGAGRQITIDDVPGIVEVIAVVAGSISSQAGSDREDRASLKKLAAAVDPTVMAVLQHYPSGSAAALAALQTSKYLPAERKDFDAVITDTLLHSTASATDRKEVSAQIEYIVAQNQHKRLLTAISSTLDSYFSEAECAKPPKSKRSSKRTKKSSKKTLPTDTAALLLDELVTCCARGSLRDVLASYEASSLSPVLALLENSLSEFCEPDQVALPRSLLQTYLKLILLKEDETELGDVLRWAQHTLLAVIDDAEPSKKKAGSKRKATTTPDSDLVSVGRIVLDDILACLADALMFGIRGSDFIHEAAATFSSMLKTDYAGAILRPAARFTAQVACCTHSADPHALDFIVQGLCSDMLSAACRQAGGDAALVSSSSLQPLLTHLLKIYSMRGNTEQFLSALSRAARVGVVAHEAKRSSVEEPIPAAIDFVLDFAARSEQVEAAFVGQLGLEGMGAEPTKADVAAVLAIVQRIMDGGELAKPVNTSCQRVLSSFVNGAARLPTDASETADEAQTMLQELRAC